MANKTNVYFDIIASFVLQNSTGVNTSFSYGTLDPAQRASQCIQNELNGDYNTRNITIARVQRLAYVCRLIYQIMLSLSAR